MADRYVDYVQNSLAFDDVLREIISFGEWVEKHFGIPQQEGDDFFNEYSEGDGGTLAAHQS